MTLRRSVVAIAIGLIVVFQIGVPAISLLSPRPARFGWQMYSVAQPAPAAWAAAANGDLEPLSLQDHWAVLRAEIDDVAGFARQVCALTDSPEVVVELRPGAREPVACD